MKNKVHLAQLGFISRLWAFNRNVIYIHTKPHVYKHHQRGATHKHTMSAQTHLESVDVIFQLIDPAGQGCELHVPARLTVQSSQELYGKWQSGKTNQSSQRFEHPAYEGIFTVYKKHFSFHTEV